MAVRDHHGFPIYSRGEVMADAVVHGAGVVLALAGGLWLVLAAGPDATRAELACLVVYAGGIFLMMLASAAYNMARPGPVKQWLRRMDHAAIHVAIAATYTPFAVLRVPEPTGVVLAAVVWTVGLIGILLKLLAPRRFERLGMVLYLGMGWAVLPVIGDWLAAMTPAALWLILGGGLLYTAGVLFHLAERLPYHNALWHLSVLTAAGLHFAAVGTEFVWR